MNTFLLSKLIRKPKHIIRFSDSIEKAAEILLKRELPHCPVVDDNDFFAGQITDSTLIKILFMKKNGSSITCIRHAKKYLIQPPVINLKTSNKEIVEKIFQSQTHRIFIVDRNKKLIGLVDGKSILRLLLVGQNN